MIPNDLPVSEVLQELGIHGTSTITPLQGGFDMAMWKVEHGDQTYALRVFRAEEYAACKHEQLVMNAARSASLPVPEVHIVGAWQNYPAMLMAWQPGHTIEAELLARPWHVWRVGVAFGRMQARLHAIPAPEPLRSWPHEWITWKCDGEQVLHDRLRQTVCNEGTLLHLDYHPRNVLTDGKRITGIVDWTNAYAGDPRADAARTMAILLLDPLARRPFTRWLGMRIFTLAWRVGYQRERGPLKDMSLFYIWAGTTLQNDLADRYIHTPQALYPARRWTNKWKKRTRYQN